MAKSSPWLKWKLGAGSALLLAFLLNNVKSDPAFTAAAEKNGAVPPEEPFAGQTNDPVIGDWQDGENPPAVSDDNNGRRSGHRRREADRRSFGASGNGGGSGSSTDSGTGGTYGSNTQPDNGQFSPLSPDQNQTFDQPTVRTKRS